MDIHVEIDRVGQEEMKKGTEKGKVRVKREGRRRRGPTYFMHGHESVSFI